MDGHLALKAIVGLAAIVSVWLDLRPEKRKPNADPFIAVAEAVERHRCRYARWAVRVIQLSLGIYLLWTVIILILT